MYSFKSRVRYSEVNSEQELTLSALMDYLQDCCTFQSEELNIGVDYLKEEHSAWVLSSWEIFVHRYPKFTEEIVINTWPYDFKGFYGYRNFTITDAQGEVIAAANSLWVYMDTNKMRPAKIGEHLTDIYKLEIEPMLAFEWSDRKIRITGEAERKEPVTVQKFHIDTNHHMNNSKYVMTAENYLPEQFEIGSVRVEYKKAAVLGDILYPEIVAEDKKVTVSLTDEKGTPYAVIVFMQK